MSHFPFPSLYPYFPGDQYAAGINNTTVSIHRWWSNSINNLYQLEIKPRSYENKCYYIMCYYIMCAYILFIYIIINHIYVALCISCNYVAMVNTFFFSLEFYPILLFLLILRIKQNRRFHHSAKIIGLNIVILAWLLFIIKKN